jgi:hypothetical protein
MTPTFDFPSAMRPGLSVSPWLGMVFYPFLSTVMMHLPSLTSIHERSAREKISSDQVAHVLNDEVSRKYIQSLKRCVLQAILHIALA